jgi:peptidoglycan hydrolase-like protein with peptidoglycan-binding domain
MIKFRNVAAMLALSSVAALPACSMFGGGTNSSQSSSASASRPPALSQDMVQQVQTRLQQAGDYNRSIDGLWGPATEAGVRSYQQQHNLNATGQLDGDTLASLNLGGTNQTLGTAQPAAIAPPVASAQPTAIVPPVASAQPVASPMPVASAQPTSQVSGASNTVPTNANMAPSNATQPNASTTP